MPHITIECSENIGRELKLTDLAETVHAAALGTGVFPVGGTRTRVVEHAVYRIADGDPENKFVHVAVRIAAGRDLATKKRVGGAIFAALCEFLEPFSATEPLGISLEVQEIDPELNFKKNNLHEYVEKRRGATVTR
ncbi:MAG: 5-carboxymethyl-2-hydroxymuconate Delta-isomerase [Candidatus Eremiobacteraeota bacterium]|nr:5-carboxymethyl-2-hydroxymuconate Delta-isomerase [Candidatus Eremiobacteraeota bacterium]